MSSDDSDLGTLRHLLHREQAFFDIEHQQVKLFEKDSFESIRSLIFTTRKVYSLHLSVIDSSDTQSDVPDLATLTQSLPSGYSATIQREFQTEVGKLLSDLSLLSKRSDELLVSHPELANTLVFSFLPALFSCLWSLEETGRFIDFVLQLDKAHWQTMTRVLIVHPTCFVYLSSLQSEALRLLAQPVEPAQIIELFKSRAFLFPVALKMMIKKVENKGEFFLQNVLVPVLTKPALYGLLPSTETRTFEGVCEKFDSEIVQQLVDFVLEQEHTIQMQPSEGDLASVLGSHEQLIYLLKDDCAVLQATCNMDLPTIENEGVYQVTHKRSMARSGSRDQLKMAKLVDADPFEALLRSLVIQLDVAHAGKDIIDTLESALMLHAGASRLQFELRLDEFKQMKRQREAPDDVQYYVELLTKAYEQRMKHRKETLSNSTASDLFKVQHLQSSQAVQFLQKTRQMMIFNAWATQEDGPFENTASMVAELCSNPESFRNEYKRLIQSFTAFMEQRKVKLARDQYIPIVYNKLTQIVSLSEFRKHKPELLEADAAVSRMIESSREQLYANNSQSFLVTFKENPQLMGLSAEHLRRAFDEDSVIPIAEGIDRALNALIHVLSFQGYKEIGADHWLPMTIVLFIHVNPPGVVSLAEYMFQFLLTLPDYNPISQSLEYNVTMARSTATYLQTEASKFTTPCDK